MSKQSWKGSTLLNPEPPVLVSCGGLDKPNLITIGWTGTICTQPSMVSISVRPERYSHHLIKESGQFAINLPTEALVKSVDWCGVRSGRDFDKFAACKLHSAPGSVLTDCPILEESPVNLECRVTQVIPLGSHDLFLAEVVACDVDESLLDENGKLCLDKAKLIVYSHGEYLALGKKLGTFGYSVRKKKHGGNNFPVLDNSHKTNYTKNRKDTATSGQPHSRTMAQKLEPSPLPRWRFSVFSTIMVIVNSPIWKVIRIASPPFGKCKPTACRTVAVPCRQSSKISITQVSMICNHKSRRMHCASRGFDFISADHSDI